MKKNKRWWEVKNISEEVGEIKVFGDIDTFGWWGDAVTFKDFDDKLRELKNVKKINLRINSYGGVVSEAVSMYNSLKRFAKDNGIETITYIEGMAASAATIVALASDKVYMGTGTRFMIHNPSLGIRGNAEELKRAAQHLEDIKEDIISIYSTKSSLDREKISEYMDNEKYFSVQEAIANGFVDSESDLDENTLQNNVKNLGMEVFNKFFPELATTTVNVAKIENKIIEGGEEMSLKNVQDFKNQFPSLAKDYEAEIKNQIEGEVKNKSEESIKSERERMQALDKIKTVNEKQREMIAKAKYETGATADQVIVEMYKTGAFEANAMIEAGKKEQKEKGNENITNFASEGRTSIEDVEDRIINEDIKNKGDGANE